MARVRRFARKYKPVKEWAEAIGKVQKLHNKLYKKGLLVKKIVLSAGSKTAR